MLRGERLLFITSDEAEEAWRIIDPVRNVWSAGGVPMLEYRSGGKPPDRPITMETAKTRR
jgi:glucose-6-phosphate 1-dehydrogenase